MEHGERHDSAVRTLVTGCLDAVSTDGRLKDRVNCRACAGLLYTLLFRRLPLAAAGEVMTGVQDEIGNLMAVCMAPGDRISVYDHSFATFYREMMLEITSYSMPPAATEIMRSRITGIAEEIIRERVNAGRLFGKEEE